MPDNNKKEEVHIYKFTNNLINETSPYLQAHAHNPVRWYPWGDAAFKKAKKENKLIFLSIGYHACHWCHVMEKESFEDLDVAELLNRNFVCIKVDREERKDLDAIYMKACQFISGTGGWPLNLWLTPDKLPIYAGTYFTKNTYMEKPGILQVSEYLANIYIESPNKIVNQSFDIITKLKRMENHREAVLSPTILKDTMTALHQNFDPEFGGFSKAPKFPSPHQILFALESDNEDDRNTGLKTLWQMAKGGIYDHIGGGFSRYSVDHKWLIPHFEKMLYDNALLLDVYTKAYDLTGDEKIKIVIDETFEFLKDELRSPKGAFYTAYDADSEGVEGKYYRFSYVEILEVLGDDLGTMFIDAYGVTTKGNFEGHNIVNLIDSTMDTMLNAELKEARNQLKAYRDKRVKPALDDKILSMSNGFMIHGLCEMYKYLGNEEALNRAVDVYKYIKKYMINDTYTLLSSVREQVGNIEGMIDDYASVIRATLALFDVTQEEAYLDDSLALMRKAIELFYDEEHGGFFVGSKENKGLIYNPKEIYDGATPSGNSLMAMNLLKCFLITEDVQYKGFLDIMIESFSHHLNNYKQHTSYLMRVVKLLSEGTKELKVYTPDNNKRKQVVNWMVSQKGYTVSKLIVDESMCIEGEATVYSCENNTCQQPEKIEL